MEQHSEGAPAQPENPNPKFIAKRASYAEDFSKTVVPFGDISMKFVSFGVEYGKVVVSYLFLINAGGLAGILALYPLVRDNNQIWLHQAMIPAVLFGLGLLCATIAAGLAYLNFNDNAKIYFTRAMDDDIWLKHWHFNLHKPSTQAFSETNQKLMVAASRRTAITAYASVGVGLISATFAALGGITLLLSLLPATVR